MKRTRSQAGAMAKNKGKRGERELAAYLKALGFTTARRGVQFQGGNDSPDVVCEELPHLNIECKRVRRWTWSMLRGWIAKVRRESRKDQMPVILFRADKGEWAAWFDNRGDAECRALSGLVLFDPGDICTALKECNQLMVDHVAS